MFDINALKEQGQQMKSEEEKRKQEFLSAFDKDFEAFLRYIRRAAVKDCEDRIRKFYANQERIGSNDSCAGLHSKSSFFGKETKYWYTWRIEIKLRSAYRWSFEKDRAEEINKKHNDFMHEYDIDIIRTMHGEGKNPDRTTNHVYDFETQDTLISNLTIDNRWVDTNKNDPKYLARQLVKYFEENNKLAGDPEITFGVLKNTDDYVNLYVYINLPDLSANR